MGQYESNLYSTYTRPNSIKWWRTKPVVEQIELLRGWLVQAKLVMVERGGATTEILPNLVRSFQILWRFH